MPTPNKIHLGPNLRGRLSLHRYDLTDLVYMTNAVANENTYALTRNAIREGIFEAIEYEQ